MKILLIGGSGQLGLEFLSLKIPNNLSFLSPDSNQLDIRNRVQIKNFVEKYNPDIVLNFSAYTNVNKAEENLEDCLEINHIGVKNLVTCLNNRSIPLIHISTDYVFGRYDKGPYKALDKRGSVNNYGYSKLLGEDEIIKFSKKAIIIRTASLYGLFGDNFFKSFFKSLNEKKEMHVINDQKISLTWSYDLSICILDLLKKIERSKSWKDKNSIDIIHLINKGYTSWFEVAKIISDSINKKKYKKDITKVHPIKAIDWKNSAERPTDSRLSSSNIVDGLDIIEMPLWRDSLEKAIKIYLKGKIYE